MYTTRKRSELLKSPRLLSARPEGPNSGYLVIQEEGSIRYDCLGPINPPILLQSLPFPQNKVLSVSNRIPYTYETATITGLLFIPVLDQPLSSNLYYVIRLGSLGQAVSCSKEDDIPTCCFSLMGIGASPRPLDPNDKYQQLEIVLTDKKNKFLASSMASDGIAPAFLRRTKWSICSRVPLHFKLEEALSIDSERRANHPKINSAPSIVGKWYCPFMFVKDGTLKSQIDRSMYYQMTLEQRWEPIFSSEKKVSNPQWGFVIHRGNSVTVDAVVKAEEAFIGGKKAVLSKEREIFWFKSNGSQGDRVGLREEIVTRMNWEQERGGWVSGDDKKQVQINQVVRKETSGEWIKMKCYVLVERFSLKRVDGSLVLACDFTHSHQLRSVWK